MKMMSWDGGGMGLYDIVGGLGWIWEVVDY